VRRLIVNADDLGYDPEIDRGILEAHAGGLVTSATAMVDGPSIAGALAAAPRTLGLGVHVVLAADADPAEVPREIRRQVERFRALAGRAPTHLDSHKHVHARAGLVEPFAHAAASLGLPVRGLDGGHRARLRAAGVRTTDGFVGDAALRPCWTLDRLLDALDALGEGTTELMCHPGHRPVVARTSFGVEREVELAALRDPAARERVAVRGVTLVGWAAVGARGSPAASAADEADAT
jgi:hypothetical protein